MATDDRMSRLPWEIPAAAALTDTESRADQCDVWTDNGTDFSGPG